MKKCVKILSLIIAVILIAGCSKAEEKEYVKTCTLTSNEITQGYKLESEYKINAKGKVVEKVTSTEIVTSEDEDLLSYFEEYLSNSYSTANETYGGYTNKIVNENGKVTSTTVIDYNIMDVKKFANDNSAMKNYINSDNKILVDGIIAIYESMGATCK